MRKLVDWVTKNYEAHNESWGAMSLIMALPIALFVFTEDQILAELLRAQEKITQSPAKEVGIGNWYSVMLLGVALAWAVSWEMIPGKQHFHNFF